MKNKKMAISLVSALAIGLSAVPVGAMAEETEAMVYGTMNIPYADFYKAEFGDSSNAYEVDAFSSATTSKWSKNEEGSLFEGTYNQANDDGTGSILGVTYPVAISQADLDALGENNYNFTATEGEPAAYKIVTVTDDVASFSAVQDSEPVTADSAAVKLSTETPWGDYLIDIENAPEMGAIYGALIKTTDGKTYAMRHEENIWRGELAWSSGIKTTEPHGNSLDYEKFVDLMGATISEVVFITKDGYTTIPTDTYVPVKFAYEINVVSTSFEAPMAGNGSVPVTFTGFPDDYAKVCDIADGFTVTDDTITYENAFAGSYTLSVTDESGKYAPASVSFTLFTESVPVVYADGKLSPAEGVSDEEFSNYIKNLSTVTVNGTEYGASGRGAVAIIGEDGTVDFNAANRGTPVFDGSGNYEISVVANGYLNDYAFSVKADEPEETTTAAPATTTTTKAGTTTTTKKATTTTTKAGTTTTTKAGTSSTESPKTGVAGVGIPLAVVALAGASAVAFRKKND